MAEERNEASLPEGSRSTKAEQGWDRHSGEGYHKKQCWVSLLAPHFMGRRKLLEKQEQRTGQSTNSLPCACCSGSCLMAVNRGSLSAQLAIKTMQGTRNRERKKGCEQRWAADFKGKLPKLEHFCVLAYAGRRATKKHQCGGDHSWERYYKAVFPHTQL